MITMRPASGPRRSSTCASVQADAVGQLVDERRQVEHDVPLGGLHELTFVVDDTDERLVRPAVRLLPERLDARAAQEAVGCTYRQLAKGAADRRRERLQLRRLVTPVELGGDVNVLYSWSTR